VYISLGCGWNRYIGQLKNQRTDHFETREAMLTFFKTNLVPLISGDQMRGQFTNRKNLGGRT
jgi:hypothetical protein